MRLKFIQAVVAGIALFVASLNVSAGVISCNMESISNPYYEICLGIDSDNNTLFLDLFVPPNDVYQAVHLFNLFDSDNTVFFMANANINLPLSSDSDLFASYVVGYRAVNRQDDDLRLTLDITDDLKNSILSGNIGINYEIASGHKFSNQVDWFYGKAFYTPDEPIPSVPEPSTLGILALGLFGLVAKRRKIAR
jgi:hypothetical protein